MAATFTAVQWKELERQAMIYKYMVASVPVPYELLLPIIQNLPPSNSPSSVVTQLRYSAKQDLEPGRCKRTDGKKWRCSRDVAPNQKYCERHMHRGRPRSRKHVEPILNNKNRRPKLVVGSEAPLFVDNMNTKTLDNRALDSGSESILKNDFGEEQTSCFTDFIEAYKSSVGNVSASGLDLSIAAGGPLAEVLGAYPTGDGEVLQRTMLSLSDGSSVCSSPATPTAFQWFT